MARKPRPIDPTEGPLQAFAHDLRLVREAAGNPTYRALATTAGFAATTLSDAAGGVRPPSLEVTLAYVGACGGDVAAWEERWRGLNRALEEQRTGAKQEDEAPEPEAVAPDAPAADAPSVDAEAADSDDTRDEDETEPEAAAQDAAELHGADALEFSGYPAAPGRPRWRRPVTIAAAVIALIGALLVTRHPLLQDAKASQTSSQVDCGPMPPAPAKDATPSDFVGETYGDGAHVRTGASRNSTAVRTIPAGCHVHFTGYCLGETIYDSHGGSVDMRWFEVYGGGVVASAVIHGNPPAAMAPSHCPADRPLPSRIELSLFRSADTSDTVQLRAGGDNLGIVGFAARYVTPGSTPTATPAAPTWHHLELVNSENNQFGYAWRLGPLAGVATEQPGTSEPVAVIATACFGGDGPTRVAVAEPLPAAGDPNHVQQLQPMQLGADEQVTAEQAACRYPDGTD